MGKNQRLERLELPTRFINSEVKKTLDTPNQKLMKQEITYFLSVNNKNARLISIMLVKR